MAQPQKAITISIDKQISGHKVGRFLANAPKPFDSIALPYFSNVRDQDLGSFLRQ